MMFPMFALVFSFADFDQIINKFIFFITYIKLTKVDHRVNSSQLKSKDFNKV